MEPGKVLPISIYKWRMLTARDLWSRFTHFCCCFLHSDGLLGYQTALQELRLSHIVYLLRWRPKSLVSFSPARNYKYTFVFHSSVVAQHRCIEFNRAYRFHIDNLSSVIFFNTLHSALFLEVKRESIRANPIRNRKRTEITSRRQQCVISLMSQVTIEIDCGQSASRTKAASPTPLRYFATPGTSTIHHDFTYGDAMSKPLDSQTVGLSENQATRLPIALPFSGPKEVLYWCCQCGHGPWSWNRIPHCQLCSHRQCSRCRYRTVRA
jgi:hypothetical protein